MVNKSLPNPISDKDFAIDGQNFAAPPLAPGLYVVATPIGNLADITLRALQTLAAADVIACEDTRNSRVLLDRYGITTRLMAYHDHNGPQARPIILEQLAGGGTVALISDAGTPLIADPGYKLVVAAREAGHDVVSIPGPSAVIAALSIAGHPTDQFTFAGFLPNKAKARDAAISELGRLPGTVCLYEAPSRLASTLEALAAGLAVTARRAFAASSPSGSKPFNRVRWWNWWSTIALPKRRVARSLSCWHRRKRKKRPRRASMTPFVLR